MKGRDLVEHFLDERKEHDESSENCEKIKPSPDLAISAVLKISPLCYGAVTLRDFFLLNQNVCTDFKCTLTCGAHYQLNKVAVIKTNVRFHLTQRVAVKIQPKESHKI